MYLIRIHTPLGLRYLAPLALMLAVVACSLAGHTTMCSEAPWRIESITPAVQSHPSAPVMATNVNRAQRAVITRVRFSSAEAGAAFGAGALPFSSAEAEAAFGAGILPVLGPGIGSQLNPASAEA